MKLLRKENIMLFVICVTVYIVFELYKFATTGILIGGYVLYMVKCMLIFILLVTLQIRDRIENETKRA